MDGYEKSCSEFQGAGMQSKASGNIAENRAGCQFYSSIRKATHQNSLK